MIRDVMSFGNFLNESLDKTVTRYIISVNIDYPTRVEETGKNYIIFKDFYIVDIETRSSIQTKSTQWLFAEFIEDNKTSDIEVIGNIKPFNTLQQAFNYADDMNLSFI